MASRCGSTPRAATVGSPDEVNNYCLGHWLLLTCTISQSREVLPASACLQTARPFSAPAWSCPTARRTGGADTRYRVAGLFRDPSVVAMRALCLFDRNTADRFSKRSLRTGRWLTRHLRRGTVRLTNQQTLRAVQSPHATSPIRHQRTPAATICDRPCRRALRVGMSVQSPAAPLACLLLLLGQFLRLLDLCPTRLLEGGDSRPGCCAHLAPLRLELGRRRCAKDALKLLVQLLNALFECHCATQLRDRQTRQ